LDTIFGQFFWTNFGHLILISVLDNFFGQFLDKMSKCVGLVFGHWVLSKNHSREFWTVLDIWAMDDSTQFAPEEIIFLEQIAQDTMKDNQILKKRKRVAPIMKIAYGVRCFAILRSESKGALPILSLEPDLELHMPFFVIF
jgi:hypothetical protein